MRRRPRIGIFDHLSANRGGGQLVVARMAAVLSREYSVEIVHDGAGYALADLAGAFGLDLSLAGERIVRGSQGSFAIPGARSLRWHAVAGWRLDRALTRPYDLFVYSGHGVPPVSSAGAALAYCHFPIETRPMVDPAWRRRLDRSAKFAIYEWLWRSRIGRYQKILANSRFTASWIERGWGVRPEVVYPPVTMDGRRGSKRNLIVTLGRFDHRDRKNMAVQLEAFPRFLAGVTEPWELCMVGFCRESEQDRAHLEGLRERARSLPVTFLVNAERKTLLERLGEAKLFWHTRGFDEGGAGSGPARYQEHFGIATVEAMMAGCVPIVPASGGQPEIVEHGTSGFLCPDPDALVRHSCQLGNDRDLLSRVSRMAEERSRAFEATIFDERVKRIVEDTLAEGATTRTAW